MGRYAVVAPPVLRHEAKYRIIYGAEMRGRKQKLPRSGIGIGIGIVVGIVVAVVVAVGIGIGIVVGIVVAVGIVVGIGIVVEIVVGIGIVVVVAVGIVVAVAVGIAVGGGRMMKPQGTRTRLTQAQQYAKRAKARISGAETRKRKKTLSALLDAAFKPLERSAS